MSPRGFTRSATWRDSLALMARETGCDTVLLAVAAMQDHAYSTEVDFDTPDVLDMDDVRAVCEYAKQLGLMVIVKAMVNCRDGYWRAYIRFFDHDVPHEPTWSEWFDSYGRFVTALAGTAEQAGAQMFCVGCEMVGADHRETEWRALVSRVRASYHGLVTYNCDKYQEDKVRWWDAVDVISSSGYYPIGTMKENFARIKTAALREGKPFLFLEAGCPSREGSENCPNNWQHEGRQSLDAQTSWYGFITEMILGNPWVRGAAWWDWSAHRLYAADAAPADSGYCVYGKPAAAILKEYSRQVIIREGQS